jgi:hypothetical protein
MRMSQHEPPGATRLAYILGVPLAENVVRQWPQMGEIVRTSRLIAETAGPSRVARTRGSPATTKLPATASTGALAWIVRCERLALGQRNT